MGKKEEREDIWVVKEHYINKINSIKSNKNKFTKGI